MATIALCLHQVNKVYGNGTLALQNLDLSVQQGEFVSIVGPSGCGKSTLLKLMAGLGNPSQGTITWGLGANDRRLAFVFQEAALMPWATVVENVHLPLKLQGRSLRSCRSDIQTALNLVNLQGSENAYPRQLSGGMKMRVSIARALVTQPNIVLLDEPFGALDEMTRSRLNTELLQLWERYHWTVIFVTHNIYEAVYLSSRVVVMAAHPGRVVAEVPIPEPYPRTEDFRTSPQFSQWCRDILHLLSTPPPIEIAPEYPNFSPILPKHE